MVPDPPIATRTRSPTGRGRLRAAAGRAGASWRRVPAAWRGAIVAAVAVRAVVAVVAVAAGGMLPGLDPVGAIPEGRWPGWTGHAPRSQGWGLVGAGLERFDAMWYLAIAVDGYPEASGATPPGAAAFFPLYPLVVRVVSAAVGDHPLLAANVVSFAAAVAAFAGVHRLVEVETGDRVLARRALIALAVFPTSFFLVAPYTESLFLALSAWALVSARRARWGWAAALGAAGAATRSVGVLLALALALEAWRQHREGRDPAAELAPRSGRPPRGAWAAALLGPLAGVGAFAAFAWARYGDPLAPLRAQTGWERTWTWPTETLTDAWSAATATPGLYPSGYHTFDFLVALPVVAAAVWLLRRVPLPHGLYAAAHVLVWLAYPFPGRPLMSGYRFALAIAPLPWAFAAWTGREGVAAAWWATSGALGGILLALFVGWYYVF